MLDQNINVNGIVTTRFCDSYVSPAVIDVTIPVKLEPSPLKEVAVNASNIKVTKSKDTLTIQVEISTKFW